MSTYPLYCLSPRQLPFRLAHFYHEIVKCRITFLSVLIEAVTALAARGALIGHANIKYPRYWSSRGSKEFPDRRLEWRDCTRALPEMLKSRIAFYLDIPHACGNGCESVLWCLEKCAGRMVEQFFNRPNRLDAMSWTRNGWLKNWNFPEEPAEQDNLSALTLSGYQDSLMKGECGSFLTITVLDE